MRGLTRRQFLVRSLGVGLGALVAGALGRLGWRRWLVHSVQVAPRRRPSRVLTTHEYATLVALAERIVPRDELGPGATDLGVADRIEYWLMQDAHQLTQYRRGLRWLDEAAAVMFGPGRTFVSLSVAEQIALLEEIERVGRQLRRPAVNVLDRAWRYWDRLMTQLVGLGTGVFFFDRVRDDVLAAVYTHPRMWARLGYDGPPQPLGYWDGADGTWNIIDRCPPVKRHDFPPA